MLFAYPIEATTNNWFHDCMVSILRTIHDSFENGQTPPEWPIIIPEIHREILKSRTGLRDRLANYQEAASALYNSDPHGISRIDHALAEQNEIELLLSGACSCESISELPELIRKPIKDLFHFGFELLTELKIRDHQYHVIYNSTPYHVCPFCGCEYFDAPGAPRESLDHYLAESRYTFAAINLRNLVPMGNKCNSKYKLAQDILFSDNGTRRRSYYPYHHDGIEISLERSEPFEGTHVLFPLPRWQFDFIPDSEEVSTWDTVFHIRERYQRDILDREFISWLREFASWCRSANIQPSLQEDVIDAITRYSEHMKKMKLRDRAFLKAAVFKMLLYHYQVGNQRVVDLVNGVIIGDMD